VDDDQPPSSPSSHDRSGFECTFELEDPDAVDTDLLGWLEQRLHEVIDVLRHEPGEAAQILQTGSLEVALVTDVTMARLHEQHKGVAGTTDVLTFDLHNRETPAGSMRAPASRSADEPRSTPSLSAGSQLGHEAETNPFDENEDQNGRSEPAPAGAPHGAGEGRVLGNRTRELDGEIYLCVDEAARQADQAAHRFDVELLLYLIHGLLHLLGEDDVDEAAASRMHERENRLLRAVGCPPIAPTTGSSP